MSLKKRSIESTEAHDDTCGAHHPGPKFWYRLQIFGYYSPKMVFNAIAYAMRFSSCQINADFINRPLDLISPLSARGH